MAEAYVFAGQTVYLDSYSQSEAAAVDQFHRREGPYISEGTDRRCRTWPTRNQTLTPTDGPSHILLDSAYVRWKMVRYATVDLIFPFTCVERGEKTESAVYCVLP